MDKGACDGDHAQVRLLYASYLAYRLTGDYAFLYMQIYADIHAGFVPWFAEFICSVWVRYDAFEIDSDTSGASSARAFNFLISTCSASLCGYTGWVYLRGTLNRTFIATKLIQRRGDACAGDCSEHDGVKHHWGDLQ